jgi:transcriptional regulator of acetoin/glycerol metabolism
VIELALPALAERRDDVLPLAESFLKGRAVLTEAARESLLAHDWPGNVRELKNVIDRAVVLCDAGSVTPAVLALPSAGTSVGNRNLDEPSRETIAATLRRERGVVSRAASALGLSRQALYRRMERYGLAEGADAGREP